MSAWQECMKVLDEIDERWSRLATTVHLDWCPVCGGLGHVPNCACRGGVAFVMGCCVRCGGEGTVTAPPPKTLWTPDRDIPLEATP